MLDGSAVGEINALAIMQAGEHFISAGEDKVVKLWDYDEGISYYQGIGHSGHVTKVSYNFQTSDEIQLYSNSNLIRLFYSYFKWDNELDFD